MTNSELKPRKYGWFWGTIFGRKKTNVKKRDCNCCTNSRNTKEAELNQDKKSSDREEKKQPLLDINTRDNSNTTQNGECPGKMFSTLQRGCGFHVYFCVDNGRKPNLRNNALTRKQSEKKALENHINVDKERDSKSNRSNSNPSPPTNLRNTEKEKKLESRDSSAFNLSGSRANSKENFAGRQINSPKAKGSSILRSKKTSLRVLNRLSSPQIPYVFPESQLVYPTDVDLKSGTEPLRMPVASEERIVNKGHGEAPPGRSVRSSLGKNRGTFVRNSLISIRKKRLSFIDNMVPEIFVKLDQIEGKLAELEKIYEDKGKNITNIVGVSCNGGKSMSLDMKTSDDSSEPSNSSVTKYHRNERIQPVLITSGGEDIFINTPKSVSVVKKNRTTSKQGSKHLVFQDTQKLDDTSVHMMPSSKSFNNTNSVKHSKTNSTKDQNDQPTNLKKLCSADMWKKISEELKV